jgi:DNA-binding response OmpR family regulator
VSVLLVAAGVPQTIEGYMHVRGLTGLRQTIAIGPVASQETIKLMSGDGGGFFNTNSAHPFENPTGVSNFVEILLMLRYDVLLADEGRIALAIAARRHPDIVVLDLDLPDQDGIELIAGLRGWTSVPIIVLSARTAEEEKVVALDGGANDYMTKPFGIAEFMARLRVALRGTRRADECPVIETAHFTLDLAAKRARRGAEDVHLTATEWRMVAFLTRNAGRLVTSRRPSCSSRSGASRTPRTTTYASTRLRSAASSSPIRLTRGTSSPSHAPAFASIPASRRCDRRCRLIPPRWRVSARAAGFWNLSLPDRAVMRANLILRRTLNLCEGGGELRAAAPLLARPLEAQASDPTHGL